jgi:hypothetical protein
MIKMNNCFRCNQPLKEDEDGICYLCNERYNEWYNEEEARREEQYNFEDERYREQED